MGVIIQDLVREITWAFLFICLSIFLCFFGKMFPLHNLDEVVDNTNIFGFLRVITNLQHVAKFCYYKNTSETGVNLQGQCCDGSRG